MYYTEICKYNFHKESPLLRYKIINVNNELGQDMQVNMLTRTHFIHLLVFCCFFILSETMVKLTRYFLICHNYPLRLAEEVLNTV